MANILDNKLREDLERLKKIRANIIILYYYITGDGQHPGQQTSWRPRASEEDPRPSRPPSLLGPQGQRSTHQDHRTQGKNCRSVQEEINCLLSKSLINCSVESLCFIENLFHFQTKIMLSDSSCQYTCRVSSTLNRDTKQFGKKYLFDGRSETCWNSDQVFIFLLSFSPIKLHMMLNNTRFGSQIVNNNYLLQFAIYIFLIFLTQEQNCNSFYLRE